MSVLIAKDHIAPFEFLAGEQDIYDLLSFVIEDRLPWNQQHGSGCSRIQSDVGLHTDAERSPWVRNFEDCFCGSTLFVYNFVDANQMALKFFVGEGRRSEYGPHILREFSEILFENRRLDPNRVQCHDFENGLTRSDLFAAGFLHPDN